MKAHELRQLSADALRARADDVRAQLVRARYSRSRSKEKNVNAYSELRHELSRVLTLLAERAKKSAS
jgi:ribosomal protein L29